MLVLKKLIWILFLMILLSACDKDTTGYNTEYFLSGIVKDADSGNPVSGVNIHFTFLKFVNYNNPVLKKDKVNTSNLYSEVGKFQNYFDPYSPTTQIKYSLPNPTWMRLEIFSWPCNKFIKTLIDDSLNAGTYSITWDGTNEDSLIVTNGFYVYRLTTLEKVTEYKIVLHMTNPTYFNRENCVPAAFTNSEGKFSINNNELPPVGFSLPLTDAYGNEVGAAVVSDTFNIMLIKEGYEIKMEPFLMNMNENINLNLEISKN